ncbi:MAG: DUF342 domain-containing protein [Phycisphaerae bacterium]|nr:DUF342 domain-containing protein [Phycisphaerae bacterium]
MTLSLKISPDKMFAVLDFSQLTHEDKIDFESLVEILRLNSIDVYEMVEKDIHYFLEQFNAGIDHEQLPPIAQGLAPVSAEKGYFQWDEKLDPQKQNQTSALKDGGKINYYEQSSVITVGKGEVLGLLQRTTKGQAGKDLFGKTVPAKAQSEYIVKAGDNVEILADGITYVASENGVPTLLRDTLQVDPFIDIKSDVDFSTGNVNFPGDVHIKGDIKDLFEVQAAGDIVVDGTIEAAKVQCGGSLQVKHGIAGKEKATIIIDGNLDAKYLSHVTVWVKGDIMIHSEIVESNINCGGNVTLEKGAVYGSIITAAGTIKTPVIGSPAGTEIIVRPGIDPFLEKQINREKNKIDELSNKTNEMLSRAKEMMASLQGHPNNEVKKMAVEVMANKQQIETLQSNLLQLQEKLAQGKGTLIVNKTIYPGTKVYRNHRNIAPIAHEMLGPIEVIVQKNEQGQEILSFQVPGEHKV